MDEPCRIIGVLDNGAEGLTPAALDHIKSADLVIGAQRTLALFEFPENVQQIDMAGQLNKVAEWVMQAGQAGRRVVVLATGDPFCHGIAPFLIAKLGSDHCEVLPNVSTLQWAFAKLCRPWQEAKICSVHNRDAGEWRIGSTPEHGLYALLQTVRCHDLMAVFTSPENTPARIAQALTVEGLGDKIQMSIVSQIFQVENHESAEKIWGPLPATQCVDLVCTDPNVVILQWGQPRVNEVLFGLDDQEFLQRKPDKGLITKREVRAVSLARMQLHKSSVVWDIGAGSGAVGLEAARLCQEGHVYAIEKNLDDVIIAGKNRQQLSIGNYSLIHDKAPLGMENWPDPDAVFIGGSGGELGQLIGMGLQRLTPNGWLVMNFVTFENLNVALSTLADLGAVWEVTQLQASRSQPILHMHRLQAENPVWIVSAQRGQP
ncbi:MAG: precorrin-6y C5,15-methyltransferase (decarboxylating) subunit CbiE [Ferrovum sp.]|nr:precorrin-6y C5,15-methyltransferase (decarboxylating) subunit CbiE [Ferrovum sp.]